MIAPEIKEILDYLEEVLEEYERYVTHIGDNGLSAALLLYYRDEVQECLDDLAHDEVDLSEYWNKVRILDNLVRENVDAVVKEIGRATFNQYQIMNDPHRSRWWWYLDRTVAVPAPPRQFWEFWKA